jgi:STE24 endopeptidase
MDKSCFSGTEEKARKYSRIKYGLIIGDTAFFLAFCFIWMITGISVRLASVLGSLTNAASPYVTGPLFFLFFSFVYYIVSFPQHFYRSFLLDHQFGLSRDSIKGWFFDELKSGIVSYVIFVICLYAFYFTLGRYPQTWWIVLAAFWVMFNLVISNLAPVVIIPLFYKYEKFPNDALRTRLTGLAQSMGIRILDIYYIDFSRRTAKANALLTGLGATKRVLISDTMRQTYSDDEIAVIAAHEFAHHRLKHMMKLMIASGLASAAFFFIVYKTHAAVISIPGAPALNDPAALPVICLYLTLFGLIVQPAANALSRRFETDADDAAVKATGLAEAFISSMDKLAGQNLSDRAPSKLITWLFFDHPPVSQRIARARSSLR